MLDQTLPILWLFPAVLSKSSNGHRTLVYAIQKLVEQGCSCGVLVSSRSRFQKLSSIELPDHIALFKSSQPPAKSYCVIATDTADDELVNALRQQGHRILWWLMAPPALLGTPFPRIQPQDAVAIYSSFVLPSMSRYCFMQDPSTFDEISDLITLQRAEGISLIKRTKPKIGIYCGKARLTLLRPDLEVFLRNAELAPFDRYWPSDRQEYNQLICSLDGLICFDPLTAVILDMVCQGKPVYLPNDPFPATAYADYPLSCLNYAYANAEDFSAHLLAGEDNRPNSIRDLFGEIDRANQQGLQNLLRSMKGLVSQDLTGTSCESTVDRLRTYVRALQARSSIQPSMDGQAASARLLHLYLWCLQLPGVLRGATRMAIGFLLSTSDRLILTHLGRWILRITIYLPWTLRSIFSRLKWLLFGVHRRLCLPTIRRTFVS